jgi:hypothetical protein
MPVGTHGLSVDRDALRTRVLGERARIARLSRIRELVLGGQDGLLVPLGVVTGLAGAAVGTTAIVVGGVAEAAAGALAMGTGAWLSSRAENQLFRSEIEAEEAEMVDHPEIEREELEILFAEEGLAEDEARGVADRIVRSPVAFAKTMVEKELGLPYDEVETADGDALVVGGCTPSRRSCRCGRTSSGPHRWRCPFRWSRRGWPCSHSVTSRGGSLGSRSFAAESRSSSLALSQPEWAF